LLKVQVCSAQDVITKMACFQDNSHPAKDLPQTSGAADIEHRHTPNRQIAPQRDQAVMQAQSGVTKKLTH
jgi:hypothetical protein